MRSRFCYLLSFFLIFASQAAAGSPNILLILSDDHSAQFVGCYGNEIIKTPNLDRFAGEGMRFDLAFTTAPQCVPSRASIVTGRSPVAARITRFSSPLAPDIVTLPELLRTKGYFTGVARRYFHLDGAFTAGSVTEEILDRHQLRTFHKRVDFLDRRSTRAETVAKVNEFLDQAPSSKPFFLWLSFNDPHHPWDRNAISKPHDPQKLILPPELPDFPGVRSDLAHYYDEVSRMDAEFQSVLDVLERRGLRQNTIVIFMGDNGYAFPHGKGSLYDPGLRVPLLVRWPGVLKPGSSTRELISGEDITPTLLEAAGLTAPREMSGISFLKLLRGEKFEGRKYIFAERGPHGRATFDENTRANGYDLSRCVRSKRFKLIYNCTPYQIYAPVDSANSPSWKDIAAAQQAGRLPPQFSRAYFTHPRPIYELYDLEKDPGELNNLAGKPDYAAIELELKTALQEKMILDYDYLPLPLRE